MPDKLPLVVSGRAVNLLAKPIPGVYTAADFGLIIAIMRDLQVLAVASGVSLDILPPPFLRA